MASIEALQEKYERLGKRFDARSGNEIDPSYLLTFDFEYLGQETDISIDTQEFTAVCPWTNLPDFGKLTINYVPDRTCIELKSLKYYLYSYAGVGIIQEHATNRIINDLVQACGPLRMEVTLDYKVRGGLHTAVTARYEKPHN